MFISLSLAALAMATSPAGVLHVINEQHSSGQVTERILHLSALNCVLAAIAFNVIVTFWTTQRSGHSLQTTVDSAILLLASIALGAVFGIVLPLLLRLLGNLARDATIAFALSVILLVALTHTLKISPTLAALTFGFMARHRRIALSHTKRNFGPLGNLLKVLLFVFITSNLDWHNVIAGASLGIAIIAIRLLAKTFVTTAFAPVSGIPLRKGMLTGIGLAPLSVFMVLTLAQARYSGMALVDELTTLDALAAVILILGIIGPVCTQCALMLAKETP
jgi:Kef-type K+ transport system membrane component KefB